MMRQFAVAESKMLPSGDRKTGVRVNLAFSDIGLTLNVPSRTTPVVERPGIIDIALQVWRCLNVKSSVGILW